ncbi:TPA: hypothetical protein I7305_16495 [Vibrio parahaemolyticus]|nr:hypothetical protein [Vibrio parahaemolyticus]HAS6991736.1 hypothetical protein [Vibrio parahaemolyticus]
MSIEDIYKIAGAIVTSIGGGALIVMACSSWLGRVWANRILEKDKLKYTTELETIKSELQRESERQKVTFSLYFEGQFKIYNELWVALVELQDEVDKLWNSANHRNMRTFVRSVHRAKKQIRSSAILIEKSHYERILNSLSTFENYQVGKERLLNARMVEELSEFEISEIISHNQAQREEISRFIDYMLENMRDQLKGS